MVQTCSDRTGAGWGSGCLGGELALVAGVTWAPSPTGSLHLYILSLAFLHPHQWPDYSVLLTDTHLPSPRTSGPSSPCHLELLGGPWPHLCPPSPEGSCWVQSCTPPGLLSPTLKPRTVGSAEGRLGSQWRAAPAWLPSPPRWTSCTAWERFGAQTTWDLQLLSARGLNTRPLGSPAQNCGRLPWLLRLLSPASSQTPGGAARARAQDLEPHPPPAAPCSEP